MQRLGQGVGGVAQGSFAKSLGPVETECTGRHFWFIFFKKYTLKKKALRGKYKIKILVNVFLNSAIFRINPRPLKK